MQNRNATYRKELATLFQVQVKLRACGKSK